LKAFEDENLASISMWRGFVIFQVFAVTARAFEPDQPSEFNRQHFHPMHRSPTHRTLQRITIHNTHKKQLLCLYASKWVCVSAHGAVMILASLHGFVTVHWDHETSEALESRLQPAQAVRAA